eukprot:m.268106 g.268106  ORF g.268106 m.268106 type:complete len:254 (-) comp16254_c0_seq2:156-917(-)
MQPETHSDNVPHDAHKYTNEEFPGYNIPLLDDDNVRVQRHQLSGGLCYMHAPAVVQYYNIWHYALKSDTTADHKMLDLARVIRDTFSAEQLQHYVFDAVGGSSIEFLESILQAESIIIASHPTLYQEHLQQYGPGLVAQFEVHEDFLNDVHHHYGKPSGKYVGLHAMVLMGARESEGKRYFLLQNWWKHKQFVEVDEEYLERSAATVFFVKTPQTAIPHKLPVNSGHYFETAVDKPESYPREGNIYPREGNFF